MKSSWLVLATGAVSLSAVLAIPAAVLAQSAPGHGDMEMAQAANGQPGGGSQGPARTKSPPGAAVYFIDLKDGVRVPLKVHVRIGLVNMGISPAGAPFPGTGHAHVLIDASLPPFDEPIPADDNHVHLGGGEIETDLDLTPGPHTLQLLMADQDHVPHNPPVFSPVIHVKAALPRTPARSGAEVYFVSPRDGETVPATFTVRFGLKGMGVAPASVTRTGTGHHHLIIDAPVSDLDAAIPTDDKHLHFGGGQTETEVTLPPGAHTLQLVFADQKHRSFEPPVMSQPITVTVKEPDTTGQAKP